jgi:hypothetical protein
LREGRLLTPSQLAFRDWLVAMAYVGRDEEEAYRQVCQEAMNSLVTEPDQDARGRLLWICTVMPFGPNDQARLTELADSVLAANEASRTSEQLLFSGAALYRAGALPAARQRLEQSIHQLQSGETPIDPMTGVFTRLFLSMTYSRQGLGERAKTALKEAVGLAKVTRAPCWGDEIQLVKLQAEAQSVLGENQTGKSAE